MMIGRAAGKVDEKQDVRSSESVDSRAPARPQSQRAFFIHIYVYPYMYSDGHRLICPLPKALTRIPIGLCSPPSGLIRLRPQAHPFGSPIYVASLPAGSIVSRQLPLRSTATRRGVTGHVAHPFRSIPSTPCYRYRSTSDVLFIYIYVYPYMCLSDSVYPWLSATGSDLHTRLAPGRASFPDPPPPRL
jgi:hypothetical protein